MDDLVSATILVFLFELFSTWYPNSKVHEHLVQEDALIFALSVYLIELKYTCPRKNPWPVQKCREYLSERYISQKPLNKYAIENFINKYSDMESTTKKLGPSSHNPIPRSEVGNAGLRQSIFIHILPRNLRLQRKTRSFFPQSYPTFRSSIFAGAGANVTGIYIYTFRENR